MTSISPTFAQIHGLKKNGMHFWNNTGILCLHWNLRDPASSRIAAHELATEHHYQRSSIAFLPNSTLHPIWQKAANFNLSTTLNLKISPWARVRIWPKLCFEKISCKFWRPMTLDSTKNISKDHTCDQEIHNGESIIEKKMVFFVL